MRRSELIHIERLAAGSLLVLEEPAVPRSLPDLRFPGLDGMFGLIGLPWRPLQWVWCAISRRGTQCDAENQCRCNLAEYS